MEEPIRKAVDGFKKQMDDLKKTMENPFANFPYISSSTQRINEAIGSLKSIPRHTADDLRETIERHIKHFQSTLKENEQLLVLYSSNVDVIVVSKIGFP